MFHNLLTSINGHPVSHPKHGFKSSYQLLSRTLCYLLECILVFSIKPMQLLLLFIFNKLRKILRLNQIAFFIFPWYKILSSSDHLIAYETLYKILQLVSSERSNWCSKIITFSYLQDSWRPIVHVMEQRWIDIPFCIKTNRLKFAFLGIKEHFSG
jgi:hypothetical protein